MKCSVCKKVKLIGKFKQLRKCASCISLGNATSNNFNEMKSMTPEFKDEPTLEGKGGLDKKLPRRIFASAKHPSDSISIYVTDDMITDSHFAIGPGHPRFNKTMESFGGKPATGDTFRYDGSIKNFKGEDSFYVNSHPPSGLTKGLKFLAGNVHVHDNDVVAIEEGTPLTDVGEIRDYSQSARRSIYGNTPGPKPKDKTIQVGFVVGEGDHTVGANLELVEELAGDDVALYAPISTGSPYRLMNQKTNELVGLIMPVKLW